MTQRMELNLVGNCFQRHRELLEEALELERRMTGHADSDLLRMGTTCMRIAAHAALQTSSTDPRQALQSWRDCALAERQIRLATFHMLRDRCIDKGRYDRVFEAARRAARVREDERQRLRRWLLRMDVV